MPFACFLSKDEIIVEQGIMDLWNSVFICVRKRKSQLQCQLCTHMFVNEKE